VFFVSFVASVFVSFVAFVANAFVSFVSFVANVFVSFVANVLVSFVAFSEQHMEPGLLKSADWPILIDLYFFLGGLAGGAFVIATIAGLLGGDRYRDVARAGYYVAFLAVLPCPVLLILDLGVPSRFLNMLLVPKPSADIGVGAVTLGPLHVKPYSPMSAGAWGLLVFSACAFLCAAETWLAGRRGRSFPRVRLVAGVIGAAAGFFLAAYPGVLLGATARPLFISAHWLGALFLAVGAATGGAAIVLALGWFHGPDARAVLARVMRVTSVALVVQLVSDGDPFDRRLLDVEVLNGNMLESSRTDRATDTGTRTGHDTAK
jgi:formate-dependent nitrite reductase membrane component NrfD